MVMEEDQEQDKSNDNGLKSSDDTRPDDTRLGDVAVESPHDATNAEHDDNTSAIDDIAHQSASVLVGANDDFKSVETEVAVEKQESLNNGEEDHPPSPSQSPSPTGSGGNKDDEPEEEEEEELNPERLADVKEENSNPEGVSVAKIEPEFLPLERKIREEEEEDDDDEAELNSARGMERRQLALEVVEEEEEEEEGGEYKALQNQKSFLLEPDSSLEEESGSEEDQAAFMKELEVFHKERCLEFKPPRFYGEPLNCLK